MNNQTSSIKIMLHIGLYALVIIIGNSLYAGLVGTRGFWDIFLHYFSDRNVLGTTLYIWIFMPLLPIAEFAVAYCLWRYVISKRI